MSSDFPRLSWTGLKSLDLPPGKEHSRRWHRADLRSLLKSPRTHGGLSLPPCAWNRLPRAAPGPQPPHLLEGFVVEKHFFPQTPPLGRVLRARPRTPKRGFPVARGPYVPAERNSQRQEINDLSLPCPLGPEPCGRTAVLRKHSFGDALSSAQRISQPIGAPVNLPFPPMHFFYCYYYFLCNDFMLSIIAGVQCSVHFPRHIDVTPSHMHVYTFFSHIILLHHKWLDRGPRAIQQDLVAYPFRRQESASVNPKFPVPPPWQPCVCSLWHFYMSTASASSSYFPWTPRPPPCPHAQGRPNPSCSPEGLKGPCSQRGLRRLLTFSCVPPA